MTEGETPLKRSLALRIRARGPLSLAEYMAAALGDPVYGYYLTRDPLGVAGDFTTAPEISQMFGEVVGLWLADQASTLPRGAPVVEFGPGRGTMMADARRAAPALRERPLWFVETSTVLRAAQARAVPEARWIDSLHALPEGPMVLVANEYLDALPIRQYLADGSAWREVQVGLGQPCDDGSAPLVFGLSGPLRGVESGAGPPVEGAWVEVSAAADAAIDETARRIAAYGGAALYIDYGFRATERPAGPTLQALQAHRRADPLASPGEADLTWLPDFDALAARVRDVPGATAYLAPQGAFLAEMGIGQRAAALAAARPKEAHAIADALERLTMAAAMGSRFKVLAILPADAAHPPGFAGSPTPGSGQDETAIAGTDASVPGRSFGGPRE
ncbi:MAG: SAM-dependent methyltransferase [Pseudomonadota bacterium]